MKKMRHIAAIWTDDIRKILAEKGIIVKESGPIQIAEDDFYYELKPSLAKLKYLTDIAYVVFNKKELNESEYLLCDGFWESGYYPQPESNFDYLKYTFDLSHYCNVCGVEAIQKAPFRIKKEPKWGKHQMLGIYWVYDALFVTPHFYEQVFYPLGIEQMPVIIHKNNQEAKEIVQLVIPKIEEELNLDFLNYEVCPKCNHKKYHLQTNSYFPKYKKEPTKSIFLGKEYFGSGMNAFHGIFVNQKLKQELLLHKEVSITGLIPTY